MGALSQMNVKRTHLAKAHGWPTLLFIKEEVAGLTFFWTKICICTGVVCLTALCYSIVTLFMDTFCHLYILSFSLRVATAPMAR